MATDYMRIINAMRPDERQALESGYTRRANPNHTLSDFFKEQADLYENTPEDDPRHRTWFYGDTLNRYKGKWNEPFPSLAALKTLSRQR